MSRSINSDKSWNSTDDELDECDNSSTSNSTSRRVSCTDDINGQLITTHSMSAVIRPGSKMPRNDPLQFVKIQNNDLSKKAVEQIKLAEEVKITKEKIKEVEEEWQNNLLNWKSKRRISKSNSDDVEDQSGTSASAQRKTKTFSEILSEKAKSGHRIGYNLHKYLDGDIDNENELLFAFDNNYESNTDNDRNSDESYKSDNYDSNSTTDKHIISKKSGLGDVIVFDTALLEEFNCNRNHDQRQESSEDDDSISGEVINNSSHSSKNICRDNNSNNDLLILPNSINNEHENNNKNKLHVIENYNVVNNKNQDIQQLNATRDEKNLFSENTMADNVTKNKPEKVKVEIKDWKMQNQRENVLQYLLQQEQNANHQQRVKHQNDLNNDDYISADNHYNNYDAEEDDYDEEMERLRLEQEKSFRAKLSAFEMLAKQENENIYASVKSNNDNKVKTKEDAFKRQPPAVEELLQSEQLQQLMSPPRQIYSGQYLDDNDEESEDAINARIEQLQIERQRAQQTRQQSLLVNQPRSGHVVYQSIDYPESPPQQQHPLNRHFEKQQYYLIDEPIVKQNQIPVKQNQLPSSPPKSTPNQSIQAQPSFQTTVAPQEHLYVNQKQLFVNQMHPQFYDQIESRERFRSPSPLNKEYTENNVIYDSQKQVPAVQQTVLQLPPQTPQDPNPTQAQHQQYLYYPKPYIANKSAPIQQQQQVPSIQKAVNTALPQQKQQSVPQPQQNRPQQQQSQPPLQQQMSSSAKPQSKPQPPASKPKPQQKGYNQNHWLLQEAELRRHLATIPSATTKQQSHQAVPTQRQTNISNSSTHKTPPLAPPKGMLSVSGKKKCSSCGDELGRGCAAMVVESLSLYYHISCFRCSVCNIQLGNGTVGTDVRVRNHKLHCQNCYSNDEAGLKFSRV